jgi:predicted protein tyrosine phosphatase
MSKNSVSSHFKITICGIDELFGYADANVTHVLSILDPGEPEPEAFGSFGEHRRLELRFHDVIEESVPGYDPPQRHHIESLLAFGRAIVDSDTQETPHLLVHCHMGISRSTAAAMLLLAEAKPDRSPADIMAEIAHIRSKAWPNLRMIEIGDFLLKLDGALVKAARERHHELACALPHVAEFMRENGRARELN